CMVKMLLNLLVGFRFGGWRDCVQGGSFAVGFGGGRFGTGRQLARSVQFFEGANVPDVARVFGDRAVAGKLADAGNIQNGLAPPDFFLAIFAADDLLGRDVIGKIGNVVVAVAAMHQFVEDPAEQAVLIGTEAV